MSKPKVLITVEGGIVQSVSSNTAIDIVIVDYDLDAVDPVSISGPFDPDEYFNDEEAYKLLDDSEFPLSEEEESVKTYLKNIKF